MTETEQPKSCDHWRGNWLARIIKGIEKISD